MHYLTLRLILCIVFFTISTVIGLSEYAFYMDEFEKIGQLSYIKYRMFDFNLGDQFFSWIEQIIFLFGGILGMCASRDILKYKGEKTNVGT